MENCNTCYKNSLKKNFKLCSSCTSHIESMKSSGNFIETINMRGLSFTISKQNDEYLVNVSNGIQLGTSYNSLQEAKFSIYRLVD